MSPKKPLLRSAKSSDGRVSMSEGTPNDGASRMEKRVAIDSHTLKSIKIEADGLRYPTTSYALGMALMDSTSVMMLHRNSDPSEGMVDRLVKGLHNMWVGDGQTQKNHEQKQKNDLRMALRCFVREVGSVTQNLNSWEEAKDALSSVLIFPSEGGAEGEEKPLNKYASSHGFEYFKELIRLKTNKSSTRTDWITLPRRQPLSPAAVRDGKAEPELVESVLDESDLRMAERIAEAEKAARSKDLAAAAALEAGIAEREERERVEEEARSRATSLLRPLTDEEQTIARNAIYGIGPEDQILAESETDSVQRVSMQKLRPGVWLNDEVIHYFLLMLTRRDEQLCMDDPGRKRCHFFKSFFMTKLLDEGSMSGGGYRYANVKRWSKKVPGKDIFNLDKIFFPINVGGVHWVCAVVFMLEKRIQFYDSMGGSGMDYMKDLMRYLKDEHQAKKGSPLPDEDKWRLVPCTSDTPMQQNGFDCGVFTCMFADFLSKNCPLTFSQEHVTQCRERIALSIMNGSAIH